MAKITCLEDPLTDDITEELLSFLTDSQNDSPALELDIDLAQDTLASFHQLESVAPCETWSILSKDILELDQEHIGDFAFDFNFRSNYITPVEKDQMGRESNAVYTNVDHVQPEQSGNSLLTKVPDSVSSSHDCTESVDDLYVLPTSYPLRDALEYLSAAPAESTLIQDSPSTLGKKGKTPDDGKSQRQRRRPKVSYRNMSKEEKADFQNDSPTLELDIDLAQDTLASFHQLDFKSNYITPVEKDEMGRESNAVYTNVDHVHPAQSGNSLPTKVPDSVSSSHDCNESVDDLYVLPTSYPLRDALEYLSAAPAESTLIQDSPSTLGKKGKTPDDGKSQRQRRRPKVSYRNMSKEEKADFQNDSPTLELDIDLAQDTLASFHQLESVEPCETWSILSKDILELNQEHIGDFAFDFSFKSNYITPVEKDEMGRESNAVYTNVDHVHPAQSGNSLPTKVPDSVSSSHDCNESVDDLYVLPTSYPLRDALEYPPAAPAEPTLTQDSPSTSGKKGKTPDDGKSQRQRRRPKVSYRNMTKEEKTYRVRLLNNEASKLYRDRRKDKRTRLVQENEELEKVNDALRQKVRRIQELKEKLRKCYLCGERL
ncbi:uncharacterized protein LOC125031759 isoform X3 [Penaeus chinensis]|uniref:uncharacterized protein LOC125031759 isoform X3 n=1 Tax=Penaeus chinensis TaxID=139456 RepID=UPI001FB74A15|nr:uncharacterized protein LOC125031759 isoform X3 [Penaeus chinensis]